jgi:hypothetical protein
MMAVDSFYDHAVAAHADDVIGQLIAGFLDGAPNIDDSHFAATAAAPAGAGKSHFIGTVAEQALSRSSNAPSTIAIATPTNDQAHGLIHSLAARFPSMDIAFLHATGRELAVRPANVTEVDSRSANAHAVVVATLDKFGHPKTRPLLQAFQYLCIDEAYQADAAKYFGVGALADRHLLVGDPGQLDPFTTIEDHARWRGLPEDPVQTAVSVLLHNHPSLTQAQFPITRRLPASAVPVVRSFYGAHTFEAWTLPTARQVRMSPSMAVGHIRTIDAALDTAAGHGWALLRLPGAPVLTADPATIEAIVDLIRRTADRSTEVLSEATNGTWTPIRASAIAVAVSHNEQKDHLRVALDAAGFNHVRVDTANKLQGLEYDLVVAWHPLSGLPDADGVHLDPGRLCVMMTRHRHACIVVSHASDPEVLTMTPPPGDVWLGHDPDPSIDGWFVHRSVFDALEPFALDL